LYSSYHTSKQNPESLINQRIRDALVAINAKAKARATTRRKWKAKLMGIVTCPRGLVKKTVNKAVKKMQKPKGEVIEGENPDDWSDLGD
jgi:hypothetical protein